MALLTLGQASDECGKHKSTILDAIRSGRLSAKRDNKNQWQIDPAELFRVYPVTQHNERHNIQTERHLTPTEHNTTPSQLLEILERERVLLMAQIDDLKSDRDQWRRQATMLLEHQPKEPEQSISKEDSRLWQKLFGNRK